MSHTTEPDRHLHGAPLDWVDRVKGFGILCVVAGHIYSGFVVDAITLWHMPLFFFLSGYLFRPRQDRAAYLADKAIHLLVPYVVFLLLIGAREIRAVLASGSLYQMGAFTLTMLQGGRQLQGWWAVFWFVTCLFLTQQLANLLFTRLRPSMLALCMLACLALAYAAQPLRQFNVPWNADVVLFALPVFYLGWQYRTVSAATLKRLTPSAVLVMLAGLAAVGAGLIVPLDMKYVRYGTPVASLLACLAIIHCLLLAARWMDDEHMASRALRALGQASLVIMYVHPAINIWLRDRGHVANPHLRLLVATALPYLLYLLLARTTVTRALFLGSVRDFRSLLASWRRPAAEANSRG